MARSRILPALIAALGLMLAGGLRAQTFTALYSFTGGSDGYEPGCTLVLSGNTLYGTAAVGGDSGDGTVFAVNTDGSGFTVLHSFAGGSDGADPVAGVILSGNTLYGTAHWGGSSGYGTVFKVNTDGTGFTTLHSFSGGSDGRQSEAALVLSGSVLFGTAESGGADGSGTIFKISTNGAGFAVLHSFTATSSSTNSDGTIPVAGLISSGGNLYGTAATGGSSGRGTVFVLDTNGTGFTVLHSFAGYPGEGSAPSAELILSSNTLYGTTSGGGGLGGGTVFAVNTDGTRFATLHSFGTTGADGATPGEAPLVLSGNTLYGTASGGGSGASGTVFKVNTDGTGFAVLHTFLATDANHVNSDGAFPDAGLVLSGNTLYGTASGGGSSGYGTVFSLPLPVPPQLTLASDGSGGYFIRFQGTPNLIYRLQRAHDVTGPWSTSAPQTAPDSGLLEFDDLFPPSDRAFYRAVQQ